MARITDIRDAAAARIQDGWTPPLPAVVQTPAVFEFETDGSAGSARRVWVLRGEYRDGGPVTRQTDRTLYTVRVLVTEPYTARGQPPDDWLETRIAWVEEHVWDKLTDARTPLALTGPAAEAFPESAEATVVYDPDLLRADKLFFSETTITYRVEE